MLSGAISNAPRWSVVGLTGKATPWSRLSSSRPPPEATDETTVSNKNPAKMVGSSSTTSRALPSRSRAPGSSIGSVQAARVIAARIPAVRGIARRRRTVPARKRTR